VLPTLTIENYVKAIYLLTSPDSNEAISTGRLAARLSVSPGTVTSMLKTLKESELADYTPYEGVRLTDAGKKLALRVLRRHRLIELFLVKTLDLSWDEVHEEAENMEHAVSDLLVDRIDAFLGKPSTDPHGDPIPSADGTVAASSRHSLATCAEGDSFRLVRVMDQSPEFLRYLSDEGLPLGCEGKVTANRVESAMMTVLVGGKETSLAHRVAENLMIERVGRAGA
jgi:DtxR family transcriptional regulator, Mn-dependent transcriptional regulator